MVDIGNRSVHNSGASLSTTLAIFTATPFWVTQPVFLSCWQKSWRTTGAKLMTASHCSAKLLELWVLLLLSFLPCCLRNAMSCRIIRRLFSTSLSLVPGLMRVKVKAFDKPSIWPTKPSLRISYGKYVTPVRGSTLIVILAIFLKISLLSKENDIL